MGKGVFGPPYQFILSLEVYMKILGAIRLNDEVYLPDNAEHAEMLKERLTDRQRARLSDAGVISGPGSEAPKDENPIVEAAPVKKKATRKRPAANKPPKTKAPSKKKKKPAKKQAEGSAPWNE